MRFAAGVFYRFMNLFVNEKAVFTVQIGLSSGGFKLRTSRHSEGSTKNREWGRLRRPFAGASIQFSVVGGTYEPIQNLTHKHQNSILREGSHQALP